jgi:predicted aspartyl protease
MAFTYRYANEVPPAPYVLVILSNPDGTARTGDLPAKVDTGADRTVIPTLLAGQLGLRELERLTFAGLAGQQIELPVYSVQLVVRDLAPIIVEVAASDGEPYILLGRDVLNRYRILLDGPSGKLEIG